MANEDSQRLEEIRNSRLHRLRLLQRRQAIEGVNTPPEVVIEIAQTQRELGMVEDAITHPASAETAEAMGAGGRWLATDRKLDMVVKMLSERMDRLEEHASDRFDIQERAHTEGARLYHRLFLLLSAGLLAALIVEAFIIGSRF